MQLSDLVPYDYPAMPPPKGLTSNFDVTPRLVTVLIALNGIFLGAMLCVLAARFYVKQRIIRHFDADDYAILLGAAGSIVHSGLMIWCLRHGYGKHLWDIRAVSLTPNTLQVLVSISVVYPAVIFFVKLSIALLYRRIFFVYKTFCLLLWVFICICFGFYGAYVGICLATVVKCNNALTALSTPLCTNQSTISVISAVFNVVTDIYLLVLAIPRVLKLQLDTRKKLGLVAVFGCGSIACAVSIARLGISAGRFHSPDRFYNSALTSQMSVVEINVGIITASMYTFPKLLQTPFFQLTTYKTLWSRLSTRSDSSVSLNRETRMYEKDDANIVMHKAESRDAVKVTGKDRAWDNES